MSEDVAAVVIGYVNKLVLDLVKIYVLEVVQDHAKILAQEAAAQAVQQVVYQEMDFGRFRHLLN